MSRYSQTIRVFLTESFQLRARQLGFTLLILGAAFHGLSQETGVEYVAPSAAVPQGKAPSMQVQLLSSENGKAEYALIFGKGDEVMSGLQEFAESNHVTSAHFTAIGALTGATLAWFDPQRKMYKKIPVNGQVEVVAMVGDIALYQGKPVIHTHMVVGFPDGTTRGGHLLEAHVFPTLEAMVTVDPKAMHKRLDPETDLTLIDPALK